MILDNFFILLDFGNLLPIHTDHNLRALNLPANGITLGYLTPRTKRIALTLKQRILHKPKAHRTPPLHIHQIQLIRKLLTTQILLKLIQLLLLLKLNRRLLFRPMPACFRIHLHCFR